MSREAQVRFCERRGVRFPPPTLPVVHCVTERQALQVRNALAARMEEVGLRLHPAKTRIVYCKDDNRRGSYEHTSFTFLGYPVPCSQRAEQARHAVHGVHAGDQPAGAEEDQP